MTITDLILDEQAAMKAALERCYGVLDLCVRHPEGTFDKDLCAIDVELFGVRFRARLDDRDGHRFARFAPAGRPPDD